MDIRIPIERTLTHHDHMRLAILLAQERGASGADAPAVIPSVAMPANCAQSMLSARSTRTVHVAGRARRRAICRSCATAAWRRGDGRYVVRFRAPVSRGSSGEACSQCSATRSW